MEAAVEAEVAAVVVADTVVRPEVRLADSKEAAAHPEVEVQAASTAWPVAVEAAGVVEPEVVAEVALATAMLNLVFLFRYFINSFR